VIPSAKNKYKHGLKYWAQLYKSAAVKVYISFGQIRRFSRSNRCYVRQVRQLAARHGSKETKRARMRKDSTARAHVLL
jgi:hypothetical protein